MKSAPAPRPRSSLWFVILGLACEEPMHPYRMQVLIRQRGKDQIANVAQRNSVYQTIRALTRAGLIVERRTSRDKRHPGRTLYEATPAGRAALQAWVRHALAAPAREFPEFPAALSVLYGVQGAGDLADLLEARVAALTARLPALEAAYPEVPRLFLLDSEYQAAMVKAEVAWLRAVIGDLRAGRLRFPTEKQLAALTATPGGPSKDAVGRLARSMGVATASGRSKRRGRR